MCSAPNFTVLYFLIQSFPEQAIHVSGLCFVSATGLCNTFFCFFDICVYCGHRNESPDLVCVLCDKVLKWMDLTTLKNCICRDSMLCVDFVEENHINYKAFDDREIILCKTYATELSAFHQIDTLSDTASTYSEHYVGLVTCF